MTTVIVAGENHTIPAGTTGPIKVRYPQDPGGSATWTMDWTPYLKPAGDTIVSSEWDGGGLTVGSPTILAGARQTSLRISGGSDGIDYTVKNTIATAGGDTVVRSFILPICKR
ncbi:MAG: hypothetical protein OEW11_11260 [Nitrospirota bacterium]|nr:hypothetical protein [Nitrospirota bacterium]